MHTESYLPISTPGLRRDYKKRVRRIAEEEALTLYRYQQMSPVEIIHYYTGSRRSNASFEEAIDTIMQFNLGVMDHRNYGTA